MYEKTLEESKNALGTLQTQQDIYMESTAAHLQQLRTAAEGVYDSLLNAKDINDVVDVFTQWTKSIETVVDGLGGLKGILGVIAPLIMNAFSSNIGQIMSQTFSNFTVKEENAAKIQQLQRSIEALRDVAPETSQRYLELKNTLAGVANGIKPETFNKLSTSIEKAGAIAANVEVVNKKLATTQKELNSISAEAAKINKDNEKRLVALADAEKKLAQAKVQASNLSKDELNNLKIQNVGNSTQDAGVRKLQNQFQGHGSFAANKQAVIDAYEKQGITLNLDTAKDWLGVAREINKTIDEQITKLKTVEDIEKDINDLKAKAPTDEENEKVAKAAELEAERNALLQDRQILMNQLNDQQAHLIELEKEAIRQIGEGIGQAAAGITSIISTIDQAKNVFKIINDDDLTTVEKFKQALAGMASVVSTAIMGFSSFARAIQSFRSAGATINSVQEQYNVILVTQNKLLAENTQLQLANNAAKTGNTGAAAANTGAQGANTAAQGANTAGTVINTQATNTNTAAKIANKAATLGIIAVLGALAIAGALYLRYILSGAKAEDDLKKATEKANKTLQEQKEKYQELKEKQDSLNDLVNTYKEQQKALEGLVKGTDEWNKSMQNLSETVDRLLEEYPELIKYAQYDYKTGSYTIDQNKLEQFQKEQEKSLIQEQINTDRAALTAAQASIEELTEKQRKYGGYQDELNKAINEEIGLRRKLAIEINKELHPDKEYTSAEEYHKDLYNTAIKENLGSTTTADIVKQAIVQSVRVNQENTFDLLATAIGDKDYIASRRLAELGQSGTSGYIYDFGQKKIQDMSPAEQNERISKIIDQYFDIDAVTGKITSKASGKEVSQDIFGDNLQDLQQKLSQFTDITEVTGESLNYLINSKLITLDDLSREEITKLSNYRKNTYGNLQQDLDEKRKADFFTNNFERNAYAALVENGGIKGLEEATDLELDQLSQKIVQAYADGGIEGVEKLQNDLMGKPLKAALEFEVSNEESDALKAKMQEASITEEDLAAAREKLGYTDDFRDEQIVNLLVAEEQLNHVYQDREKIFKTLDKYDATKKSNRDQLASVQSALSTWFGSDVSQEFILKNKDDIKKLFDDALPSEERAETLRKVVDLLNEMQQMKFDETKEQIRATFASMEGAYNSGEKAEDSFVNQIKQYAADIGLTNEEDIHKMFADFGYIWNDQEQAYYKDFYIVPAIELSSSEEQSYYQKWAQSPALWSQFDDFDEYMESLGFQKKDGHWYRAEQISLDPQLTVSADKRQQAEAVAEAMRKNGFSEKQIAEQIRKVLGPGFENVSDEAINRWINHLDAELDVSVLANVDYEGADPEDFQIDTKYTAQTIKEVYKPKLDTSDIDRGLERFQLELDEVKEASKFLSGDALVANLQQQIDLETQLLEKKKEKIAREEQYQRETTSAYNDQMAEYNSKLAIAEKTSGQSFGVNIGFAYDSEGFIKNLNEIDKAYFDEEQKINAAMEGADDNTKAALTEQLNIIKSARSEISNYVSTVNSSREKSLELMKEEAKYAKTVAELEQQQAMAGADRTAATASQLADLEYQAEKTSKAFENLGDAGDLSGSALIKYNETRISLLEQQEKEAEEKQRILAEERQRLLGDAENANSLMGQANKLGVDVQFREDGSVDLDAMKADWQEIQDSQKYSNEELTQMAHYWEAIEKFGKQYNSNVDDSNKAIEDHLKYSKEIARLNASKQYAEINAELEDAAKKAGILKQNLEHAKAVFDKAGDNKKNFVKGYIESLEEYDKVQEAVLKRSAERFEKLKQDWNPKSDTTALSAAFNAEDMDSFMAVYGEAQLELIELDKELEDEISETTKSITKLTQDGYIKNREEIDELNAKLAILKERQKQVGLSADDLANKEEYLSSKMADMSQVADLSKEWKTAAVDREIKKVNRELSLLQKQQSRLKGKDVIANLQQQVAVIQKQINLEKNKLKILQAQAQTQRDLIQEMITGLQLQGLGSAFDSSGHVNAAFLDKLAKKADLANEEVQMLISALKDYESIMKEIESQQDAIVSLQDEIADKQYEISEKIYEETRKEAEKLLNKFKIEIEVELNEAEMMRKIDRLRAKVAAMPAWDLAGAMGLDIGDAVSYATKDVDILTNAVNKLMVDYQSDAWKDFYDTQKDAYDDIISYANQLTSAVESFYDALDTARQKYSEAIDKVISANQELIDDLEEMKKISKHGINITKMLFGENSYEDLTTYYKKIQNTTREQLQAAKEQAAYYKALLATIDPMKHPDEYESVKSALKSAIDETYAYAEEMGNQALEEMNAKIEDAARKLKDEFARVQGYENSTMQDLGHDYQQKILKDYLDTTESQYEMITLQNKFTKAINDTTSASEKSKLSKVMKEQVGYLQQQVEKTGRLTKYEVDRANMMYDLTLKQMALEEARDNKTKMRLRRDSQGNYRYEYIADAEKTAEAQQDLLEQQYKIYELDKKRLLELYDEKEKLIEEFNQKYIDIINNQYMTEAEKEQALNELKEQYYGENGYLIQLGRDYAEAVHNIDESADGELDKILEDIVEETGRTSEEIQNNFIDVANAMDNFANEGLAALDQYTSDVQDALASLTDGLGDLEAAVDMDINTIMELADVDLELIDVWMEQVDVCGDLMAQLEELEEYYRGVMQAALDAAEAAAKLKVTDFSTADERKGTKETTIASTGTPGGSSASASATGTASINKKKSTDDTGYLTGYVLYVNGKPAGFAQEQASDNGDVYGMNSDDYISKKYGTNYEVPSYEDLKRMKKGYANEGATVSIKRYTAKYDTGGYTGEWGADGRLAMLHQKELVLNAKDTENFLKAADVMRTLQSNIEQIQNYANTMSPSFSISAPSSDLNQNVKIEASFPGVTNSREIEDAFNNLVNLASQRAMSTRR